MFSALWSGNFALSLLFANLLFYFILFFLQSLYALLCVFCSLVFCEMCWWCVNQGKEQQFCSLPLANSCSTFSRIDCCFGPLFLPERWMKLPMKCYRTKDNSHTQERLHHMTRQLESDSIKIGQEKKRRVRRGAKPTQILAR